MALDWTSVANVLTASGIGAIVGGVANSLIQVWGSKGRDRADIAERLTESADKWLTRVEADNAKLVGQNVKLREALDSVTLVLEQLIEDCSPDKQAQLKRINKKAREALQ